MTGTDYDVMPGKPWSTMDVLALIDAVGSEEAMRPAGFREQVAQHWDDLPAPTVVNVLQVLALDLPPMHTRITAQPEPWACAALVEAGVRSVLHPADAVVYDCPDLASARLLAALQAQLYGHPSWARPAAAAGRAWCISDLRPAYGELRDTIARSPEDPDPVPE